MKKTFCLLLSTVMLIPGLVACGAAPTETTAPDYTALGIPNRADGSTLRLVMHNICTQTLTPDISRAEKLATAMKCYNADILALQETDELWHRSTENEGYGLDSILTGLGYKMVPLVSESGEWSHLTGENDRNAIFYQESKVKLIECGYDRYEVTKNMSPERPDCAYTWVLFEETATTKRFILVNTHFISAKANEEKRTESAVELAAFVKELESNYGIPVMVTGDFNSNFATEAYMTMTNSGLRSARDTAKVSVNTEFATTNTLGVRPAYGLPIDHCFHTEKGFTFQHFETLISEITYAYSDHVPILIDFSLT